MEAQRLVMSKTTCRIERQPTLSEWLVHFAAFGRITVDKWKAQTSGDVLALEGLVVLVAIALA